MMSEERYLQTLARYSGDIRTGALAFDYRTGQCSPAQPTQAQSWGSACPPGFCLPDNLPEQLNRYFAGDRNGCREIPWTVKLSATSSATLVVTATVSNVSKVTMCPTRMICVTDGTENAAQQWELTVIQFGNQNQLVGGPVSVFAFNSDAFQVVPMVPDCLRAGLPFTITATLDPETTPTARNLWVTFIGPMIG